MVDKLIKRKEAAEMLGISLDTFQAFVALLLHEK